MREASPPFWSETALVKSKPTPSFSMWESCGDHGRHGLTALRVSIIFDESSEPASFTPNVVGSALCCKISAQHQSLSSKRGSTNAIPLQHECGNATHATRTQHRYIGTRPCGLGTAMGRAVGDACAYGMDRVRRKRRRCAPATLRLMALHAACAVWSPPATTAAKSNEPPSHATTRARLAPSSTNVALCVWGVVDRR